jgi:tRNA uridine 5-carboxymethylaminomethyl modification enzyme
MYSGNIVGAGPRYCPSIETKLVRFADKERHQLFVEPCGMDTDEMYIQGFSTSMPTDVQYDMLRSLDGFENAEIMRYAYAIEYDSAEPTQMLPTLEFKSVKGLYGAGQFNGTSGYEEAAAQGLVAGINAALAIKGEPPMVLTRDSSYIGTLVDDLVTKGTNEPYRVMTSRSEYRLLLRQDNADLRLTEIGRRVGLISDERYNAFNEKKRLIAGETERVQRTVIPPSDKVNEFLRSNLSTEISTGVKLADLLRRPELSYEALAEIDPLRPELPKSVQTTVAIQIKYEGYIKRELSEVQKQKKLEEKLLPSDISYRDILGLRLEAAEKLDKIRPMNIGQASRISGVNPADISVLLIYLSSGKKQDVIT